jgi:transposase
MKSHSRSSSGGKPRRQRREVNPPKKIDLRTRRFSAAQHAHALELLASGLGPTQVAKIIGTTTQSVARWVAKAQAQTVPAEAMPTVRKNAKSTSDKEEAANKETRKLYAPRDPGQGLSEPEVAGILEWKRTHPSMGPAQLRAQLKRFKGWRLSLKAIARVLRQHGYEPVHRGSKPKGLEPPIRFEAPRRNYLAGWPRRIAPPGLPQIRTCPIQASGSSGHGFAGFRRIEWIGIASGR